MATKPACSYCHGNGFIMYGEYIRDVPHLGEAKVRKTWEGVLNRSYQCPWCGKPSDRPELPNKDKYVKK